MHTITVGIEHLMTGVIFTSPTGDSIGFERESASTMRAMSFKPFNAYWPVKGIDMDSTEVDGSPRTEKWSHGEVEWFAQVTADAMRTAEQQSYNMQTYRRIGMKLDRGEPIGFPPAVIKSMRRKFGADSDNWLANLRWAGDHWYFTKDGMYHGVEPDGYIHT